MKKRVRERERERAMQKRIILISGWIGRGQKWTAQFFQTVVIHWLKRSFI